MLFYSVWTVTRRGDGPGRDLTSTAGSVTPATAAHRTIIDDAGLTGFSRTKSRIIDYLYVVDQPSRKILIPSVLTKPRTLVRFSRKQRESFVRESNRRDVARQSATQTKHLFRYTATLSLRRWRHAW